MSDEATPVALVLLEDAQQCNFRLFQAEADGILQRLAAGGQIVVSDEQHCHTVSEALVRSKEIAKAADALRREVVDPINEQVRMVNDLFRPLSNALAQFQANAERAIIAWNRAEAARRVREQEEAAQRAAEAAQREQQAMAKMEAAKTEEARKAALEEANAAGRDQIHAIALAPTDAPVGYKTTSGSTTVKPEWDFQIVKPELVPREYCVPSPPRIKEAIKFGAREIAGVAIFEKDKVNTRRRR